jgi:integrase
MDKRKLSSEKTYWSKFYKKYTDFLYCKRNYDNYTGIQIKIIRTFFNYVNKDKGIVIGEFHKNFYAPKDNISIFVLTVEQLQFLIHNVEFEKSLGLYLQKSKDIFVFGCTVGLRVSDLMRLTKKNIEKRGNGIYLKVCTQKTMKEIRVKLPEYAINILAKYKGRKFLLPVISKGRLNLNVKELCENAGWTNEVDKIRTVRGIPKKLNNEGKKYRFCDMVTTHTMRRTAITTLLTNGVPETMVRKISGHSANSAEFYKYVEYAQSFIDIETDRAFSILNSCKN